MTSINTIPQNLTREQFAAVIALLFSVGHIDREHVFTRAGNEWRLAPTFQGVNTATGYSSESAVMDAYVDALWSLYTKRSSGVAA